MQQVQIGLAGMGNVGAGVYKNLANNRVLLTERIGAELNVRKIVVRDPARPRDVHAPAQLFTTRWQDLVEDPEIQVVVELMGGMHPARELVLGAIERGKMVVTGNKALLAEHGQEIFEAASRYKVPVFFEAAAAGGVPIIKAIREAFIANHILSMHGIVNGTSNYILTRMTESGLSFDEALREAQAAGFAEADPTLDINGWDAAHKAIILASLAYGFWVGTEKVYVEGIEKITATDIRFAAQLGYVIKLLAIIKAGKRSEIEVRVHPALIPQSHVLASVKGVFNAILVQGDVVGETLFYGRGAGQDPTSSAVISDLAEAAAALKAPRSSFGFTPHGLYGTCKPIDQIVSQYYLHIAVDDVPGVLAQVAGILGGLGIGISSVIQPEEHEPESVPLVLMVHTATQGQINCALDRIAKLNCVRRPPRMIRVETFSV
ncbi:MAG TPA: homoserine dehydrogenase [Chthoniobacteraceae bacterium]|jgi:homoserine dehydrogenase|nr:homoserine dehydrogenase [Chthoniobacteraceae bacterium]